MKYSLAALLLVGMAALAATAVADSNYPTPPNIRITAIPELNNEEQVFICPTDSLIIIANWRDFRLGYRQVGIGRSTDGGQTWTDSLIPYQMQYFAEFSWQSDPTMTVDAQGNFYMSVLDFISGQDNSSIIAFYKSTDKGVSWTGPVAHAPTGPYFEDKQFITADRTGGTYDGNIYCAWARFPNPNRIMFVRSTDGAASFGDTIVIGPNQSSSACGGNIYDAGQFAMPVVESDGDVHVFWQGTSLDSGSCTGFTALKQRISTDGGQTFGPESVVLPVSGWTSADGGINTYSQPAADADISGGPFDGNIYISFTNIGPEDSLFNSDVDFIRSTDGGLTWSNRIQINDAAGSDQIDAFHPWTVVNREGVIAVIFYDQRQDDPNYFLFDLFAAYSFDGGLTFTSNHRISDVSSSPGNLKSLDREELFTRDENDFLVPLKMDPRAGLIGEYIGLSMFGDKVNAVWTDSRDGNSEVYAANWYLPLLEPRLSLPTDSAIAQDIGDFAWSTGWKHDQDQYRLEIADDPLFQSVYTTAIVDTPFASVAGPLPEGRYYWRVRLYDQTSGDSSMWSETRIFDIDRSPPLTPILLSPLDHEIISDATPTFSWVDDSSESPLYYTLFVSTDAAFTPGPPTNTYNVIDFNNLTPPDPLTDGVTVYWKVSVADRAGNVSESEVREVTYIDWICGDVDGSGGVNVSDITYLVDFLFRGGPQPVILAAGNIDGDGGINVADLTYLVAFLFSGGPSPIC